MNSSDEDCVRDLTKEINLGEHSVNHHSGSNARDKDEEIEESGFRYQDIFLQKSLFYPLLVVLVLMFLFQFSGQGAITFYTALIFQQAQSAVDPNDCALIIGVTYFVSSILGLILKKHFGRRALLLISEIGMALSQISLGVYFYMLNFKNLNLNKEVIKMTSTTSAVNSTFNAPSSTDKFDSKSSFDRDFDWVHWLPLPLLIVFTLAFNIGMGSLTWVVATEISPVRSRRFTHTVASLTSNFWWFVVTKTFKDVYRDLGPHVPFFLYGFICLVGFIFVYVFLPETQGLTAEERDEAFRGIQPIINRITGSCIRSPSDRVSTRQRNSGLQCLEQQPLTDNSPSPSNTTPLKQQNHIFRSSSKPSDSIHAMYQMRPLRNPSSSSPNLQHFHPPLNNHQLQQQRQVSSMNFNSPSTCQPTQNNDSYGCDPKNVNCATNTSSNNPKDDITTHIKDQDDTTTTLENNGTVAT